MDKLNIWWHNKNINPFTKRKIKDNGRVYKKLLKDCLIEKHIKDNYHNFHGTKIDPILKVELPLQPKKPLFEYKYCWDPLTGKKLSIDPRGSLYFDPNTLVHYFYYNRLKYLYDDSNDVNFSGSYGDGLGNGPHFYIPGRGFSPHYYLFRLPLSDAFLDNHSYQQITLGPILEYDEIVIIYTLAKKYNNFYKTLYNKNLPNLLEIYDTYNDAILKNYNEEFDFLDKEELKNISYLYNKLAVDKLRKM